MGAEGFRWHLLQLTHACIQYEHKCVTDIATLSAEGFVDGLSLVQSPSTWFYSSKKAYKIAITSLMLRGWGNGSIGIVVEMRDFFALT